jgi:hypothetical protein
VSRTSNSHRIGRFFVDGHFVDLENIPLRRIMERVVVLRAEFSYERRGFEYVVLCEDFEEVPRHSLVPEYLIIVSQTPEGNVSIKWELCK